MKKNLAKISIFFIKATNLDSKFLYRKNHLQLYKIHNNMKNMKKYIKKLNLIKIIEKRVYLINFKIIIINTFNIY